jgi:hypothetical protein
MLESPRLKSLDSSIKGGLLLSDHQKVNLPTETYSFGDEVTPGDPRPAATQGCAFLTWSSPDPQLSFKKRKFSLSVELQNFERCPLFDE